MRNLFLSLTFMVALLLPQSLWADGEPTRPSVVPNSPTITIYTSAPGQVTTAWVTGILNGKSVQPSEITSIVLDGKFNTSDLEAIQSSNGFSNVTTVDMSEAVFQRAVSGESAQNPNRWVKSEAFTSLGSGMHAYVGGDLYQYSIHKSWSLTEDRPGNETIYETNDLMNAATSSSSVGSYAKVPIYKYCQMTYGSTPTWVRITNGGYQGSEEVNYRDNGSGDDIVNVLNVDHIDSHINDFSDNKVIIVKVYYKKVAQEGKTNGVWSTTKYYNPQDYDSAPEKFDGDAWNADENHLDDQYGAVGSYIFFKHYYRKNTSRSWVDNNSPDVTTAPENVTIIDGNFAYNDRNNYMDYPNETWVKMTTGDYNYYKLESQDNGSWTNVTGSYDFMDHDIIGRYGDTGSLPTNNDSNDMKFAIVMGTEMIFDGTSWHGIEDSETVTDYSQMKFSYWSETLQTAKTSKYADSNINSEIFQNCKKITRIDFLGGHVKGLNSRTTGTGENNYANFTLFVGKDVTEIEGGALNQSSALTGLEFDRNYEGMTSEELKNYPKELTIGNDAFNDCYNVFEIVIPNRCVSIGNAAFKHVGNGADAGISFTPNDNENPDQKLTLTFERRNAKDTDQGYVGIDCNFPLQIGNSAFMDCWYLVDLSLPIRLETMGNNCFMNTLSLKTLQMREETNATYTPPSGHDLLRTIPTGAFFDSAIEELKIPQCVTLIEDGAFGDTEHLKKVTFQTNKESKESLDDNTLVIKSGAFTKGKEEGRPQLDVYVMVNPDERRIVCEYHAFNFTQTVGQTNTSTVNPSFAYLHFPEEYWDYYQGDWKRGLAFQQGNLNAMKDGFNGTNNGKECHGKSSGTISNTGIYEDNDGNDNTQYAPANGWQEFSRTSTSIDIEIPTGSFLRSFSTKKPLAIPVYASGTYQDQTMFDIYRISAFSYVENNSSATATKVEVHTGNNSEVTTDLYVPKGSGFLMVGKGDGGYLLYMKELNEDETTATYPFTAEGENPNLLYPTCLDEQFVRPASWPAKAKTPTLVNDGAGVMLYPTIPHPFSPTKAPLKYRIFGLTKDDGHQGQFDRIAAETVVTRDKAYLRLTPEQFPLSNEGSYGGGNSGLGNNLGSAPIMLSFMDPDGSTTDVRMINPETMTIMEDCYYTLQGVKLNARPTQQGIYIHNGKKVVIK